MNNPTSGKLEIRGSSQIYAGDKLILIAAIKDVPDAIERMENLKLAKASKDMKAALEIAYSYLSQCCYDDREQWKEVEDVLNKHFKETTQ